VDVLRQQADEAYQERDPTAALSRAGLSGAGKSMNGKSPTIEAWVRRLEVDEGQVLRQSDDKDRMIDELRSEVKRTKEKYYSLKSSTRSPPVHYSHYSSHSRKSRKHDRHHHSGAMVVSDADGNVVMDPDHLTRTVEELQDKVNKIRRYLPDYMY
jgi:hypothetical protein